MNISRLGVTGPIGNERVLLLEYISCKKPRTSVRGFSMYKLNLDGHHVQQVSGTGFTKRNTCGYHDVVPLFGQFLV